MASTRTSSSATATDRSGEAFYYSPKYKASVGGIYRFNERLTFNTDVTYQSSAPSAYEFDSAGKVNGERRSDNYVLANFSSEFKIHQERGCLGLREKRLRQALRHQQPR